MIIFKDMQTITLKNQSFCISNKILIRPNLRFLLEEKEKDFYLMGKLLQSVIASIFIVTASSNENYEVTSCNQETSGVSRQI